MTVRPIRISLHALGGQGGGVLADWIVDLAETEGWRAQATSVPGVAQRTGATVYYIEIAPVAPGVRDPLFALMPTPGDVDIVLAAELMEAGRAIVRGFVTPDRTMLIASTHRVYAIAEKSAMGDGLHSPSRVLDVARTAARSTILLDLDALAMRHGSVISATLFGALAGSGALPFPVSAFEAAIERGGKGIVASLAAFNAARAADAVSDSAAGVCQAALPTGPVKMPFPPAVALLAQTACDRLRDYQSAAYSTLYLDRLEAVCASDAQLGGADRDWAFSAAVARHLALWMSYEDVIRVADVKTRGTRFARAGVGTAGVDRQLVDISEFMSPGTAEVADLLPPRLGRWLLESRKPRRLLEWLLGDGRVIRTSRLPGFLMLWTMARLRRWRPHSFRYREEQARIETWLTSAINAARVDYDLGVEVIRLQQLVKGYSDTHARGLHNFGRIMAVLPRLVERPDSPAALAELRQAALKDEEGRALALALDRRLGGGQKLAA